MEVEETIKKLRSITQDISDYLLNSEMVVTEQFEEILADYEKNITEISNSVIKYGSLAFSKLHELEEENSKKLKEIIDADMQASPGANNFKCDAEVLFKPDCRF